jgi:hypothetical protein
MRIPREVPKTSLLRTLFVHVVVAGLLPFSSIYIELFYIFESVWAHKPYVLFGTFSPCSCGFCLYSHAVVEGILAVVFVILLTVTAAVTVAVTYVPVSPPFPIESSCPRHSLCCCGEVPIGA